MRGRQQFRFDDFQRGVNALDAPYLLADGLARDARNVVSTRRGSLAKRRGCTPFCPTTDELTGLWGFQSPQKMVASTTTGKILGIAANGTVTTLKTGVTNTPWCWVAGPALGDNYPLYGTSLGLTDIPQRWNGVAGSTVNWTKGDGSPMPRALYLLYAGNRMWFAHVSGDGSAVLWSDLGNPTSMPAANITRFDPDDGEYMSGIGTARQYVLVFKPSKSWVIYDLDTSANRVLSKSVGCVSHRSIVETPKGTFWLSRDGVYSTDGNDLTKVSDAITPLLRALPAAGLASASGAFFEDHYLLSASTTGGRNDIVFDLDLQTGAWWVHTMPVAMFAAWAPSTARLLYGAKAASSGAVLRCLVDGVTTDEGQPFSSYWQSSWHTFGSTTNRKRVRQVHFDGTGRVLFRLAKGFSPGAELIRDIDFDTAGGAFGVNDGGLWGVNDGSFWGGDLELGEVECYTPGVARAWSVIVGNDTADDFAIHSYTFNVDQRKD